jgi:Tfp pilus assembly protein PilF
MQKQENDLSFRDLFVPLTTRKIIGFIVIIGLIVFLNMLFNGFVMDDKTFIASNPEIHSWSIISFFRSSLFNSNGHYRPIPAIYFTLIFNLFNGNVFVLHFFQLVIHIVNTILFYLLLSKFTNKKLSFLLSLIFLVHPLQVESVSYIASSDNPLFFLFGLSALLLSSQTNQSYKKFFCTSILLMLCVLTKETGFVFVLLALLYQLLFQQDNRLIAFIGAFSLFLLYFGVRLGLSHVLFMKPEAAAISRLSLVSRLTNSPIILVYYIKTCFFPTQLVVDQQWLIKNISINEFFLPLIVSLVFFVLTATAGIYLQKTSKKSFSVYTFFFLWFWGGISLHLQIFPLDATVADRWMYFPLAGLLGMLGVLLNNIKIGWSKKGYIIVATILVLLSVRTIIRNLDWTDAFTLYSHDSKIHTNYNMENNLGLEYFSKGDYEEAIVHYKYSAEMLPYDATFANLAQTYDKIGQLAQARKHYLEAINTKNKSPNTRDLILMIAYERLGYISIRLDPPGKATAFIKQALTMYPNSPSLWVDLAIGEQKMGNQPDALAAAKKAVNLLPNTGTRRIYNQIQNRQMIQLSN